MGIPCISKFCLLPYCTIAATNSALYVANNHATLLPLSQVQDNFQRGIPATDTLGAGAYTPGMLGVQCTPFETEHDVTFSTSCDQGKITKKYKDYYVLSSLKVCAVRVYSTALVFEEHLRKLLLPL